jgi:hypothetical protein
MDAQPLTLEQLNMIRHIYGDPGRIIHSPEFRAVVREELRAILLEQETRQAVIFILAGLQREIPLHFQPEIHPEARTGVIRDG